MAGDTQVDESLEKEDEAYQEADYRLEREGPDRPASGLAYRLPASAWLAGRRGRRDRRFEDVPEMLRRLDANQIRLRAAFDPAERGRWPARTLAGEVTVVNAGGPHAISMERARLITLEPEATAKLQTA